MWAATLTLLAGLSTGLARVFHPPAARDLLAFSLAWAGSWLRLVRGLLPKAVDMVGRGKGVLAFFLGIVFIGIVDLLVPEAENPHNFEGIDEPRSPDEQHHLMRAGVMTALAISIHNVPEGLATFASALSNTQLGIFIALAIAIHNIPEGIAVSMPISTRREKNKAFVYSFLSGVAEPVGAVLGYLVLMPFLTPAVLAGTLAFVAGIMVYISLDELLPMAHRYGHGHLVISGVVLGMLIMAVSLLML
jgi:ZIP family zinc transporter